MPFPKNEYLKFKMSIENNNYNDNKLNGNNNGSSLFGNNNNNADIYVDSYLYKQHAPTNNTNLFASNTQIIFGINQNYIPTNSLFSNKNNLKFVIFFSLFFRRFLNKSFLRLFHYWSWFWKRFFFFRRKP